MAAPESKSWPGFSRILILGAAALSLWFLAGRFWPGAGPVDGPGLPLAVDKLGLPLAVDKPELPLASGAPQVQSAESVPVPGRVDAAPHFDTVRVGPRGDVVIAGRATPGAEVTVRDGSTEVARTQADKQGAFVALPAERFRPGSRELTLSSRSAGGAEMAGDGSVVLTVPPESGAGALAVLVPNAAAPHVLQGAGVDGARHKPGVLTLDQVDYDDKGSIRFTGGAAAGAIVRLYVDNGVAGDTRADATGRWMLVPGVAMTAGVHKVRVDQVDGAGRVLSRVELPFQRAVPSAAELASAGGRVIVQPGQNLWRLARSAYGRGVQYTVIYLANQDQIRDPRMIYPGQTFSVPATGR